MKTIEQIAADILVECQYKDAVGTCLNASDRWSIEFGGSGCLPVDPFADTLESRRQADALMTHFSKINMLIEYYISGKSQPMDEFEGRKEAIEWCLERTAKQAPQTD